MFRTRSRARKTVWMSALCGAGLLGTLVACEHEHQWRGAHRRSNDEIKRLSDPQAAREEMAKVLMMVAAPKSQEPSETAKKSEGCMSCHGETDDADLHPLQNLEIGCVDCHGGNADVWNPMGQEAFAKTETDKDGKTKLVFVGARPGVAGEPITDKAYLEAMYKAHVQPRNADAWYGRKHLNEGTRKFGEEHGHAHPHELYGSRNPENTYALLNDESPDFIRFINPGDLRVADMACGACHNDASKGDQARYRVVDCVRHSMMAHGAQLWGAVLYNNGSTDDKVYRYGESYSPFGIPQRMQYMLVQAKDENDAGMRNPTVEEMEKRGVLPYLDPLPTWNIAQPGNILRIFERGQRLLNPEIGLPIPFTEPGKADKALSPRGLGTLLKADPVFLGIQKTRLLDPILWFLGTNDHPGDFRQSGCTACHVVYANDRKAYAITDPAKGGKPEYARTDYFAAFGNQGHTATKDPTIPKGEKGHPIKHAMAPGSGIPNSQCVICHIHPGTSYANTYLGYMWWDNESDGEVMYPERSRFPTPEQEWYSQRRNPEASSLKGLWSDLYPEEPNHLGILAGPNFLQRVGEPKRADGQKVINELTKHNQFADFHGHGWIFRAIYKKDRHGNMLDRAGAKIDPADPNKWDKGVHLMDVHLEKGMQCIDCHFVQDMHGSGRLYGETRMAVEITCIDCHGTYSEYATLLTSGPASIGMGKDGKGRNLLTESRVKGFDAKGNVVDKPRFEWKSDRATGRRTLIQRSSMDPTVEWTVVQTADTIDPNSAWSKAHPQSAEMSRFAKTVQKQRGPNGQFVWGDMPSKPEKITDPRDPKKQIDGRVADQSGLAHSESDMECYTCHTSWMTSCAGCHLPMRANQRTPMLHNENLYTRNFTQYNYQVLREDTYMIGRDSALKAWANGRDPVKQGGKVVPIRSSSAVLVSSQNAQREWIYSQQQTVSGEGYSGQAFNPHFPHATSAAGTTKNCGDCHVSKENDNNAWLAQTYLQGTNFVNFLGRFVYVAAGGSGLEAVVVTERDDPQAVFGSHLHSLAYPDEFSKFVAGGRRLKEAYEHGADAVLEFSGSEILDLQLRGEYLYTARGRGGFLAFDVANIDNKGFSERIIASPVSPLGQNLGFKTSYAVAVASPATIAVDPARTRKTKDGSKPTRIMLDPMDPAVDVNMEQAVHPMYAYIYIADRDEGLVMTFAGTLLDGDPQNNFMDRAKLEDGTTAFNPGGVLSGMTHLVCAGHYIYATSASGLHVIDINKPTAPKLVASLGTESFTNPQSVAVQFRYAFVTDGQGMKVVDVTNPTAPRLVPGALVPLKEAKRVYAARTYAFVAGGSEGVAIIDIEKAEEPKLVQVFNAAGAINDARDVKVGMTNASLYAYVADGKNGLRIVQLMGPSTTPQFKGFAPPLTPTLIATYKTHGAALAVSKGLDRDRAVDETGNQVAVFGRLGARPFTLAESQRMYLKDGQVWRVPADGKPDSAAGAFTWDYFTKFKPPAAKPKDEDEE